MFTHMLPKCNLPLLSKSNSEKRIKMNDDMVMRLAFPTLHCSPCIKINTLLYMLGFSTWVFCLETLQFLSYVHVELI